MYTMSIDLESVENVVVNILSRHDCGCLPVSDLFVLCSRVYAEHLLPQLGLGPAHHPAELRSLDAFSDFLRTWNTSNVVLVGEGTNGMAQLCLPLAQSEEAEPVLAACSSSGPTARSAPFGAFEHADASDNSAGSSTHPFYDPEAGSDAWAPGKSRQGGHLQKHLASTEDRVTFVRQLLCRCVFDFVLKESNALSYASAMPLDDARQTCIQYLVRLSTFLP